MLGPIGDVTFQVIELFGLFQREYVTLASSNSSIVLKVLEKSDCLVSFGNSECLGRKGFSLSILFRIRTLEENFALFTTPAIKILYLVNDEIEVQISSKAGPFKLKSHGVKNVILNILLIFAKNHTNFYLNGNLEKTLIMSDTFDFQNPTSFDTIFIGHQERIRGKNVQVDIFNVAITEKIMSDAILYELMGLTMKEFNTLKHYDNFWTFSGELRYIQRVIPTLLGPGAKLISGPDSETWAGRASSDRMWGIRLASAEQISKSNVPLVAITNPSGCFAVILSFNIRLFVSNYGDITSYCGRNHVGWYIRQNGLFLEVVVNTISTELTKIFQLSAEHFDTWINLHLFWTREPPKIQAFIGEDEVFGESQVSHLILYNN